MFDPKQLLESKIEGANATKIPAKLPGEYVFSVKSVKTDGGTIGKGERTGQPWGSLVLMLDIIDGPELGSFRHSIMLDLTPYGTLAQDPESNVRLGRLREAVGLNQPGKTFEFTQLVGTTFRGRVEHVIDRTDPENVLAEIKKVSAV